MRAKKCDHIVVNDIFDELLAENKRLFNELLFANNCIQVFNRIEFHLKTIHSKYESIIGSEDKEEFNQLEDELKLTLNSKHQIECNDRTIDANDGQTKQELSHRSDETIDIKPRIVENVRRSGRTKRKCYTVITGRERDPSKPKKPKWTPKEYVIPDPVLEPNSLLLLRLNTYDPITQSFVCPNPYCDKSFSTKKLLYCHFHHSHHTKKRFPCPVQGCNKMFKTGQQVKHHQFIVHSEERPFECTVEGCGYKCKTKIGLEQHVTCKHSEVKPFKCPECDKLFKLESQMNYHYKVRHTCHAFVCRFDECGQSFTSKRQLMNHRAREHNVVYKRTRKWHDCDWPACGYRTNHRDKWEEHKYIHTGERPFVCDWVQCGKGFRSKAKLRDHRMIHLNIRPYACHWPGCNYRCTFHGNLNKHMRVHKKQ